MYTVKGARGAAERARQDAERAYVTSEYPRLGRGCYLDKAAAFEALAETLERIGEKPPTATSNPYADRRSRRVWSLELRAALKRLESAELACRSHDMDKHRPMGQPLVGSPARRRTQRRAIERANAVSDEASAAYREAEELRRRAVAAKSNRAISSDDPEALERLRAKLARLESERAQLKAARKASATPLLNYRAAEGLEVMNRYHAGETYRLEQREMTRAEWSALRAELKGSVKVAPGAHRVRAVMGIRNRHHAVYLIDSKAHPRPTDESAPGSGPPSWALTNLGNRIRQVRERISQLEASADEPTPEAPILELPGCRVEDWGPERNRYALVSEAKPPREVTRGLRGLGLRWMRSEVAWVAWRNARGRIAAESGAKLYSDWYAGAHGEGS